MRRAILLAVLSAVAGASQNGDAPQRIFENAESLMRAGRPADAAKAYQQVLRAKPDFAEAYFALGVCYIHLGKAQDAVASLRSYLKLRPKSADAHAVLGIVLLGEGQPSEARPQLETALRLDPAQPEAVKALGRVYNFDGDAAKAVRLLRPLVNSPAADDEARTILARALLSSGDAAGAAALLDRLLAANPKAPPQTWLLAGIAARDARDLPKSMDICERGLRVYPNWERLEGFYASLPAEALNDRANQRLEGLRKNSNDVDELIALGRVLMIAGKGKRSGVLAAGGALLERAVQVAPENAAARYHYGRWLQARVKADEAAVQFRKGVATVRDPELRVLILRRLGVSEERLENLDAAGEAFRECMEINRKLSPPIPEAAFEYYNFLVARERDAEARALLEEILRWEPMFAAARLERAKRLAEEAQPKEVIGEANVALRNTEDPELLRAAHYLLMKAYRALGQEQAAREHADWVESHTK